jgi:protein-S-isoprenylcysteine O-methyltransferase Ste14
VQLPLDPLPVTAAPEPALRHVVRWRGLLLGRVVPVLAFGAALVVQGTHATTAIGVLGRRGASTADLGGAIDTVLLVAYYAVLVCLYCVRLPASDGDRRPQVLIAAFAGAYLITTVPLMPPAPRRDWLLWPSDLLTAAGLVFTLWSLLSLRRSFSIIPQARRLVTNGPYGLCRNPLYLGEAVGGWAAFLPTIGWAGALVLATSLGFQLVRVFAEERVLTRSFGQEYLDYCRRVPRFFPSPRRRRARGGVPKAEGVG